MCIIELTFHLHQTKNESPMAFTKRPVENEVTSSSKKQRINPRDQPWQAELKTPLDRLTQICKGSRFTDLTISFPGSDEKLEAHRVILAMTSPVFECMFYGPMAMGNEIELPEDPIEGFKWLLEYIYCGRKDLPDVNIAVDVYLLADKYQIEDLALHCSEYLQENLHEDNLLQIYETAKLLEDKDLIQQYRMVISFSSEAVLLSPNIGKFSRSFMLRFLLGNLYVASEVTVFKGLLNWAMAQTEYKDDPQKLRKIVNLFLRYVNFLSMSTDEFLEHVASSNIFTPEESLSILMEIKNLNDTQPAKAVEQWGRRIRKVGDYRIACKLPHTPSTFCGYTDDNGCTRRKVISDLKVSCFCFLESIVLQFPCSVNPKDWVLEVIDSSERVLRKVSFDDAGNELVTSTLSASFSTVLMMRPKNSYNIWIQSTLKDPELSFKEYSMEHNSFKIACSVWREAETKIKFIGLNKGNI